MEALPAPFFDLVPLLFGLVVGSFANVCIHRIPLRESVVRPPSRCPSCGARVRAYDNVPVLSWLWLRGRCRSCRAPIAVRYPLVESANGLLYYGLAAVGGFTLWTLVAMVLGTVLLVLSLIDLDHHLLPNAITLPGIAAGVLASFIPEWGHTTRESILAALGGYLAFSAVATVFEKVRGVEGLGQGDWKMAAMLGAFLGPKQLMLVVLLACLAGALVGLSLMAFRGRDSRFALPFGTFLGVSAIATLFVGDRLVRWYSTLLPNG